MEGLFIGIGMLLAILGPLLLLPAIWLVYRILAWPLRQLATEPQGLLDGFLGYRRLAALAVAAVLVLGSVGGSYAWGRAEFDRLCILRGTPEIHRVVLVNGYFQTPLFPYQARQSLDDGTFKFLEGPGQRPEGFRRYTLDGHGGLEEVEISELSSQYGYRETFETAPGASR